MDSSGNLFVADTDNRRVRRVDASTGIITTVAGYGTNGFSGDGSSATAASLSYPQGLALDGQGNLFIVDRDNQRVRRVDAATGIITTISGNGFIGSTGDSAPATSVSFNFPVDIALDSQATCSLRTTRITLSAMSRGYRASRTGSPAGPWPVGPARTGRSDGGLNALAAGSAFGQHRRNQIDSGRTGFGFDSSSATGPPPHEAHHAIGCSAEVRPKSR
jgi:hypothetical protein